MASIIKSLISLASGGPFYVRIRRDRLIVRDASGNGSFDDEPLVGISEGENPTIVAIGATTRVASCRRVNPFSHPRVIISDFTIAEKLMQHAFAVTSGARFLRAAPIAVVHVTEPMEGGLSQIERRALHELVEGAGARRSYIWEGKELTDEELRAGVYQSAH